MEAVLAQHGLADVVRDELGEQLCVCGNKAELSFFFQSLVCCALPLCDLLSFCFLASPQPENRHMVCCQLHAEPRAVRHYRSEITA